VELLLLNCAAGLADFSSVEGLRVMQNYQLTGGEAMGSREEQWRKRTCRGRSGPLLQM